MQERIDALIKMRKEKPEHKYNWDRLRTALVHEKGLLTDEQTAQLNKAFTEADRHDLLKVWDDRFHEVLITGEMRNGYDVRLDPVVDANALWPTNTTPNTMLTSASMQQAAHDMYKEQMKQQKAEEMSRMYAQYKDEQIKKTKCKR